MPNALYPKWKEQLLFQMGIGWEVRNRKIKQDDDIIINAVIKCFLQIQK